MIRKTADTIKAHVQSGKKILELATRRKGGSPISINEQSIKKARLYIDRFWVNLERYHPSDEDTLLGLPNPYLVPAHDPISTFNFDEMYYWDSYFMIQGMLQDDSRKELVMGILENLFTLLQRYKVIPNASRTYLMGRSQPPLLTSFIFDVYEAYSLDKRWLERAISYAQTEYSIVWMGEQKPHDRSVHKGLSRYYDINILHDLAEAESGWDMTIRFDRRCLDYLPVDLNALLYKYESDFARAADILGKHDEQKRWELAARKRKKMMDELMWNDAKGLYFDYDFKRQKRGTVASLASFVPLWAGMVSKEQAQRLEKSLKRFEARGGLLTTDGQTLRAGLPQKTPTQWAHPNGWAPLHFFVVQGLSRYGYHNQARQIALKWLQTNLDWFEKNGVFLEKYNVVNPDKSPIEGVYPSQTGFGWTNAVFERFCQDYVDAA